MLENQEMGIFSRPAAMMTPQSHRPLVLQCIPSLYRYSGTEVLDVLVYFAL